MAAINQRIPNFLGGVSQQPDSIKYPGQLRVCDNAYPDVTFGLTKRPPAEFVKKLSGVQTGGTSYWYNILRDGDEKYIMQIKVGGAIKIWDVLTGNEETVTTNDSSYLNSATKPFGIQTIGDYTLITNPDKVVAKSSSNIPDASISGDYAFVRLDTVAYNTEYVLYKGEPPSQNTKYRVTEVTAYTSDGTSFEITNNNDVDSGAQQNEYSGQKGWGSTSGADAARGHLAVNGSSYIYKQEQKWDPDAYAADGDFGDIGDTDDTQFGGKDSSNFLGYSAVYRTRYVGTPSLNDGGRYDSVTTGTDYNNGTTLAEFGVRGKTWRIKAAAKESFKTYEGVSDVAYFRTPRDMEKGPVTMAAILKGIKDSLPHSWSGTVIGNGILITGTDADKVNFLGGTVNEGMTVITKSTTDISRLPAQCKDGYTVRVDNSEESDSDNYYLQFKADSGSEGAGKWEEVAAPNNITDDTETKGWDRDTMPHILYHNRSANNWTFGKVDDVSNNKNDPDKWNEWKIRDSGDINTNPIPTIEGKSIQKMFFYRNRLGLVADQTVLMSRPGDYLNFFNVSGITISDDNPIDIEVNDIRPAYVHHVLNIQKGVMMFSEQAQFLLFSESDIFSPKTARLKKVSNYECNPSISPVDMGTSVQWASTTGAYSRTFEAIIVDDDAPPQVVELTRVIPEFIPNDVTLSANSSALGLVTYGKSGDSNLYHYKYFDTGQRRDQSAWFSWKLKGALQHGLYTSGNFHAVTLENSEYILSRHEFVTKSDANNSYTLGTGTVGSPTTTSRWFEACLDFMEVKSSFSAPVSGLTSITLSHTPSSFADIYLVVLSGTEAGTVVKADSSSSGTTAKFKIDLSSGTHKAAVGYKYETLIELPNLYTVVGENAKDLDADLRISGINFEMGVSGPMEFELSSRYGDVDTYTQYESGMLIGTGQYSEPPAVLQKSVRVPIQRKNDKYTLKVKIPDPFSTALISASWDGRYNTRRHVRK